MVLRCAWGTCNGDERYKEKLEAEGVKLIRFPKPRRALEKCKRWIKACGRPHEQLNLDKIDQHKAVCSKHFVGGKGPTKDFPDPINADGMTRCTPVRKAPKRRIFTPDSSNKRQMNVLTENTTILNSPVEEDLFVAETVTSTESCDHAMAKSGDTNSTSAQTEEHWLSPVDMLALASENARLKEALKKKTDEMTDMKKKMSDMKKKMSDMGKDLTQQKKKIKELEKPAVFNTHLISVRSKKVKNLFKFYTGIERERFDVLLRFLTEDGTSVTYPCKRKDILKLDDENALFLTLCRLRQGFALTDLAIRFGLTLQSTGEVFNVWLDHMYYKLSQIPLWPQREVIVENMPKAHRRDYPTSLIIIDGTEVKTQVPNALALQSQCYSEYKSSTTLKGLIGCDPNGNLMFVSELHTGAISDKALTELSGFYATVEQMKSCGGIQDGDAIMADKGFTIKTEIEALGLELNIPPFAHAGCQMAPSDSTLTTKVAKHRVHIERLIGKVKTYRLLSRHIPTTLFHKANEIWTVCCHLTLFQDNFVTDKKT